jgi:hypothetical protein
VIGLSALFIFQRNAFTASGSVVDGTYEIVARHSRKAMDALNLGTANGNQTIQWSY